MINVVCNQCGRDDWRLRFPQTLANGSVPNTDAFRCTSPGYGAHAQIVQCNHCGLVYANPRWSAEDLSVAYEAVEDLTYVNEREGRELTFKNHLQAMESRLGAAEGRLLLDVGAYIGVFVEIAAAAGWQACGIEPSAWAAALAQERGTKVIQGTLDTPALSGSSFDVVTMWDVIEHLDDPVAELRKSYELMRPGGWLVVHTMDIDSLAARLMGRRWPWLMDMHLYYFSRATLQAMLEKAGFQVEWSGAKGRYLRLGYLSTRLGALSAGLGKAAEAMISSLRLQERAIPVNFGDLITIYARRPT